MWKHYGGDRAIFFDLRGDENGNLTCIEIFSGSSGELCLLLTSALSCSWCSLMEPHLPTSFSAYRCHAF